MNKLKSNSAIVVNNWFNWQPKGWTRFDLFPSDLIFIIVIGGVLAVSVLEFQHVVTKAGGGYHFGTECGLREYPSYVNYIASLAYLICRSTIILTFYLKTKARFIRLSLFLAFMIFAPIQFNMTSPHLSETCASF